MSKPTSKPTTGLGHLPPEVLIQIIASLPAKDLPATWFTCRRVSRTFKSATEGAFRQYHIPSLKLHFFPNEYGSDADFPMTTDIHFVFKAFSSDGKRAIMSEASTHPRRNPDPQALRRARADLRDLVNSWQPDSPSMMEFPFHIVELGGIKRDSELHDVQFDLDSLQLSLPWELMLNLFLGEEEYAKQEFYRAAHVPCRTGKTLALLQNMREGIERRLRPVRISKWHRRHADVKLGNEARIGVNCAFAYDNFLANKGDVWTRDLWDMDVEKEGGIQKGTGGSRVLDNEFSGLLVEDGIDETQFVSSHGTKRRRRTMAGRFELGPEHLAGRI
ncbi:hypothetical protein GE09DRAFT_742647 [Coniochaeta sp. 2T2.1]|nr:hypothetical protein GE09DRAFT_742647 [Coniochaeta sp. 2T2.1]